MSIESRLLDYLGSRMAGARNLVLAQLSREGYGASRETFSFDIEWKENDVSKSRRLILRRDPPTGLLDHCSLETEFRILKSLEGSGIPVPKVLWYECDPEILERPFVIMERIEGSVTPAFQVVGGSNEDFRLQIAEDFVSVLARIHNLDWRKYGLEFLGEPSGPCDYAIKSIVRWEGILNEVRLEPDLLLTEALLWLKSNITPAKETCLVHGDYKADNIMYDGNGIRAVFDWEMALLGDPHDDLGWVCMQYYSADGLINGLMPRGRFLNRYEEISGRRVDAAAVRFWQVFANMKMATITLTALHRYASGTSEKNVFALLPLIMSKLHKDIIELLDL